jgi:hypothetical protein
VRVCERASVRACALLVSGPSSRLAFFAADVAVHFVVVRTHESSVRGVDVASIRLLQLVLWTIIPVTASRRVGPPGRLCSLSGHVTHSSLSEHHLPRQGCQAGMQARGAPGSWHHMRSRDIRCASRRRGRTSLPMPEALQCYASISAKVFTERMTLPFGGFVLMSAARMCLGSAV